MNSENGDCFEVRTDSATVKVGLFEDIFCSLSVPAILIDCSGTILLSNSTFDSFLACAPGVSMQSRNLFDFLQKSDGKNVGKFFESFVRSRNNSASLDAYLQDCQKAAKFAEVTFIRLTTSEQILVVLVDKTEIGLSHEELKQKTEDLENLFYIISHNMKSPIVSIQGYAKLLLEASSAGTSTVCTHYVERIVQNAAKMNMMVQDILEFSKVSNKLPAPTGVSLQDILTQVRAECFFQIKKKNIHFDVPEDLPVVVADAEEIGSVFLNLVENAIKYIGDEPNPEVEIAWEDKARFYVFSVRDNGPGIDQKFHETVFDLFERAQAADKTDGSGVGLAVVKRVVEKHGGFVKLYSKPGQGTTVYFTLPKYALHAEIPELDN